ncbi:hypothetical protein [Enterovirga aerilata]|uniref:Uncharacterized protein n=1 Tax=Enterovirga aerilata TaxID=2730920 RepID=A0A849IFK7_9HYPH|nr:hypothetical protein [Enterovirga sp. DB1703]NNM74747.1 hypothetical protein [Enterovirga sp. DB1703]
MLTASAIAGWLIRSTIGRSILIALAVLAAWAAYTHYVGEKAREEVLNEIRQEEQARLNNALDAADRARRDVSDPSRLRDDDGFRRQD